MLSDGQPSDAGRGDNENRCFFAGGRLSGDPPLLLLSSSPEAGESSVSRVIEDRCTVRVKAGSWHARSVDAVEHLREAYSCGMWFGTLDGDEGALDDREPDWRVPERDLQTC